jgi:hypothetical protein
VGRDDGRPSGPSLSGGYPLTSFLACSSPSPFSIAISIFLGEYFRRGPSRHSCAAPSRSWRGSPPSSTDCGVFSSSCPPSVSWR